MGSNNANSAKQCWICFATEEDDPGQQWTKPCMCKGTTKWVHQGCLLIWIDEKMKSSRTGSIKCPQCKLEYRIFYPASNILVKFLDSMDSLMYRISPFLAGAVVIGLVYWSAVTYGMIITIQVMGAEEAGAKLNSWKPGTVLVGLPSVPVFLLGFTMLHWEERTLEGLRAVGPRIPILRHVLPSASQEGDVRQPGVTEEAKTTRKLVSALLLTPLLATFCGNLFFSSSVQNPVKRTLLGWLTINAVNGIFVMYHKQMNYKKYFARKVLDYEPSEQQQQPVAQPSPA